MKFLPAPSEKNFPLKFVQFPSEEGNIKHGMPLDQEKSKSMLEEVQDYCFKNSEKIKDTMVYPDQFSKIIFNIKESKSKPEPEPEYEPGSRLKPELIIESKLEPRPKPKSIESKPVIRKSDRMGKAPSRYIEDSETDSDFSANAHVSNLEYISNICFDLKKTTTNIHDSKFNTAKSITYQGHKQSKNVLVEKSEGLSTTKMKINPKNVIPSKICDSKFMVPKKASLLDIHPEKTCSDCCFFCWQKFGLFDTPLHISQIKSLEIQKFATDYSKLSNDACLCDKCFRLVNREAQKSKQELEKEPKMIDENYGNTGCRVFKQGIQKWNGFFLKINILKGNV